MRKSIELFLRGRFPSQTLSWAAEAIHLTLRKNSFSTCHKMPVEGQVNQVTAVIYREGWCVTMEARDALE